MKFLVEPLEPRVLLSGNVLAAFFGSDLIVLGDSDDNDISIVSIEGKVSLAGNDGTTINGNSDSFTLAENGDEIPGSVIAHLRSGNDRFIIEDGVIVNRSVIIFAGSGNDAVGISGASVLGNVMVFAEQGDDEIAMNDASLVGNLHINSASGDDVVSIIDSNFANNVVVKSGAGNDAVVIETTDIARDLQVRGQAGQDGLVIRNANLGDDLFAFMGRGEDFLYIDPTTISDLSLVGMGSGDDNAVYVLANEFNGPSIVVGGSGHDSVETDPANIFNGPRIEVLVESSDVSQSVVDMRLLDSSQGAWAQSSQAQMMFDNAPDDNNLELTVDISQNKVIDSAGLPLVNDSSFIIQGTTNPGATVEVARDGDGVFDDAATIADANGNYALTVTLVNAGNGLGANHLRVRTSQSNEQVTQDVGTYFAVGPVVRMASEFGNIDIELFLDDNNVLTETSANFLNYLVSNGLADSRFDNSIIHRSVNLANAGVSVIQGGGFEFINGTLQEIPEDPSIANEAGVSNIPGTIAMALTSINNQVDLNSATSQWYLNVDDNSNALDPQSFAVFGRVIGNGMDVAKTIHALDTFDISEFEGNNLTNVPLQDYLGTTKKLTGTVSIANGSDQLIGVDTAFTTELTAGQRIQVGSAVFTVGQVDSATQATLQSNAQSEFATEDAFVGSPPVVENFVRFTTIAQLEFPT